MLSSLVKKIKVFKMAKNSRKKGKAVRNGNAPSPYTKYNKKPYEYSAAYNTWKFNVINNRGSNVTSIRRGESLRTPDKRGMMMAAE